jgi:OOP family OmpA-OmpF porin
VFVVQGPQAIVAGVVRGTPPPSLRVTLQDALETIHLQFAPDLAAFSGDSRPFDAAKPILEACAVSQYREPARRRRVSWGWITAGALLAIAAGIWFALAWRDGRRWDGYLARVRAEPGLVVLDADRRGRTFVINGLRDPLAADPGSFLAAAGIDASRVSARWQSFQALDPDFIARRATTLLRPPAGVTLRVNDGVLYVAGDVAPAWVYDAMRLAPAIAGLRGVDPALLTASAAALRTRLEAVSLTFVRGRAELAPEQDAAIQSMRDLLREADAAARAAGTTVGVHLIGHTDADGPDALNLPLSRARAATVRAMIDALALPGVRLTSDGVGSTQPLAPGPGEIEKQRNRRVSFVVREGLGVAARSDR